MRREMVEREKGKRKKKKRNERDGEASVRLCGVGEGGEEGRRKKYFKSKKKSKKKRNYYVLVKRCSCGASGYIFSRVINYIEQI